MATSREWETIEHIENTIAKAKSKKCDVTYVLSREKSYYQKALSAIYNCGLFTAISAGYSMIVAIILNILQLSNEYHEAPYIFGVFLGIFIVCIVPLELGIKLVQLNSTPRFTLGLLIATLVFNLFFSVGILPAIALVFNILALVRWSTYKDWFYNIGTKK